MFLDEDSHYTAIPEDIIIEEQEFSRFWRESLINQSSSVPLETKDSQQADLMRLCRYGQESEDPAHAR